jgi:hypothetical protein
VSRRALAIALGVALVVLGTGCAGRRWAPSLAPADPLIAVPVGAPVVGLGAKVSTRGLIPKRCLAKAETTTATGAYSVEIRPAEAAAEWDDAAMAAFVAGCAKRAEQARPPGGADPVAALLVVSSSGWTSLEEGTAELAEEARRPLAEGQLWEFFERCGTRYIQAARRAPSALVYVALYPADAAERARWAAEIAARAGQAPDDLLALRALDDLVGARRAFLMIRADADQTLEVHGVGRGPGHGAGALVGQVLKAGFGADRGKIAELSLRPWSQLPQAALLLGRADPVEQEPARRERLFQLLQIIQGRALDRQTLLAQLSEAGGGDGCHAALERSLGSFSWPAFYECRDGARDALPERLEEVEACRPVLAAVGAEDLPQACAGVAVDDGRFGDPRRRQDTRYPLLIEPAKSPRTPLDDHLFEDAQQLAPPVGPGSAGAQTDRWGEEYRTACVRSPPRPGEEPSPLPKPWSQDDWDPFTAPGGTELPKEQKPPAPEPKPPPKQEEGPVCIESPGKAPLCIHPKGEQPASPAPTSSASAQSAPTSSAPTSSAPASPSSAPSAPTSSAPAAAKAEETPAQSAAPPPKPQEVVLGVSASERYEGERSWPWWKKLLFPLFRGWKAPEPRPIYRSAYELRTLKEPERSDEVELTEEAEALAKRDLAAFYRRCGTHRVRQVVERKGVAYHFAPGSPGDREITVLPYGVSRQSTERPELQPQRAQPFLDDQAPWLELLSAPSPALPQQLVLEPWSELLLESGTVQPHQLSPLPGK